MTRLFVLAIVGCLAIASIQTAGTYCDLQQRLPILGEIRTLSFRGVYLPRGALWNYKTVGYAAASCTTILRSNDRSLVSGQR